MSALPVSRSGVVSDDMSDRQERKMIAHRHNSVGRDAVQDTLTGVDRLGGVVVEDRRPLGVLQACHRTMGDCRPYARTAPCCSMGHQIKRTASRGMRYGERD